MSSKTKKSKAVAESPVVQVIKGRLFSVYFESLYVEARVAGDVHSCKAIARTTEEAIEKVHAAFPGKAIYSVHSSELMGFSDRIQEDHIVV